MTARRSTQDERRSATREQLLAAAERVFSERGYQGASIGAITAEAETGHGTFYLHFRNKDEVFLQVVDRAMKELYEDSFRGIAGRDSRGLIRRYLETFVRHGPIFRCLVSGSLTSPVIEESWKEIRNRCIERIQLAIEHWQANGKIPAVDAYVLSNVAVSMVEWSSVTQYLLDIGPGSATPIDTTAEAIDVLWSRLFTEGSSA